MADGVSLFWRFFERDFVAFDHTARGTGLERLCAENPALRQAAAAVLCAVRNDRLPVSVSSGWVLLPPSIAAALSPLSFDLERRVLNRDPRPELPVKLQSTAYTWSQVRGFRRLYARTRAEQPRGLVAE
jgi:hypothetical protein